MAELNLSQITDRLNREFVGDGRRLVFWYDAKGEFAEDIADLELENAKIWHLAPDNQFQTKVVLEREDPKSNYLIYAPFPRPDVRDNHLEDMLLYSKQFYADRTSLLAARLGIAEQFRPVLARHIAYFGDKERTKRFCDLEIETYDEESILTGLICAVCRTRTCSFEDALRTVLTQSDLTENQYLSEMEKYGLTEDFWRLCAAHFGYSEDQPTLERLLVTLFVTDTARSVPAELPAAWRPFCSDRSGNVAAFLDNLMNNVLYQGQYDALSAHVAEILQAETVLAGFPPETLTECDTFLAVDRILVRWLTERLVAEDTGATLNGMTIPQLCEKRRKMHFGDRTRRQYLLLEQAVTLIQAAGYACPEEGIPDLCAAYARRDFAVDQAYRQFYACYDALEGAEAFQDLRSLAENIYTNEYLARLLPRWNEAMLTPDSLWCLPLQRDFYARRVRPISERVVVIISDAMRYEVAEELCRRLEDNPKCTVKLETMVSTLPSFTRLGMAALLPHRSLTVTEDCKVQVDDRPCDDLADREAILQSYCPESRCVQYDDIKNMNRGSLRKVFTTKQVVYVYHNQIDARGDKANTEDEVFTACDEAVREISELIQRLSVSANTLHFIVTADHGFIYKRDKLTERDKISGFDDKNAFVNRRFILSEKPVSGEGIASLPLGEMLGNQDERFVSFPVGSNVFKVTGGGQNYVHGGSSPQEMLVPVLDVKTEKNHMETHPAEIQLVTQLRKITNLIVRLSFHQTEPVGDRVKSARYRLYFVSEDGEHISGEVLLDADSRDADAQNRIFRLTFTFKNRKYDSGKPCYLVAVNDATGIEVWRHAVIMDLAFGDDFGF